jgi:uncharacterized protein
MINLTKTQFKNTFYIGLISFAVFGLSLPSFAVTVEQVPNPRQANGTWVTDMADVLTPDTEVEINRIISDLEKKTSSEMAVVTVTETTSSTPKQFATQLFNRWGIGKAGKNNGVLFLISTGGKRVEIETGSGLQVILPNQTVKSIIDQQIVPNFKQNDYNGGTLSGTKALVNKLDSSNQSSVNQNSQDLPQIIGKDPTHESFDLLNDLLLPLLTLGSPILFVGLIFFIFRSKSKKYGKKNIQGNFSHPRSHDIGSYSSPNDSSSSSSYDSGSSSSSSSDFGGGSSSGGGDGGSW